MMMMVSSTIFCVIVFMLNFGDFVDCFFARALQ